MVFQSLPRPSLSVYLLFTFTRPKSERKSKEGKKKRERRKAGRRKEGRRKKGRRERKKEGKRERKNVNHYGTLSNSNYFIYCVIL